MSDLAKNAISKSPIVSKVFLNKVLKLFLYHSIFSFKVMFLLMPLLIYCFVKKQDSKKDLIWLFNLNAFKIVFISLVKIIAI